jgi:t-SNARE complex subunit (syntaxin)
LKLNIIFRIQCIFALLCFTSVSVAHAKDVSAQQAGVEYARQEVEKADAQHKSDLKQVTDAEKLLEQRKKAFEEQTKLLADDRKKAELSKQRLQESNTKLTKAQAILDQAWKE